MFYPTVYRTASQYHGLSRDFLGLAAQQILQQKQWNPVACESLSMCSLQREFLTSAGVVDKLLPLIEGEHPDAVTDTAVAALLGVSTQPLVGWRPQLVEKLLQRLCSHPVPDEKLKFSACILMVTGTSAEPLATVNAPTTASCPNIAHQGCV